MDLKQFEAAAWSALEEAPRDAQDAFRYLALCTVDLAQRPQARTVVLRQCKGRSRTLTFHTDVRSPKWQEMAANPQVTALGYCHQRRLQLRLAGLAECYDAGSEIAQAAWQALSPQTRQTYSGGPPGEALASASTADSSVAEPGRLRFGVVILRVSELDVYQLQRDNHQRARFRYAASGEPPQSEWLHP
ncbi:pyridoxamine 5'-phosphate oxidase family protein [Pantoea sp. C2G6]|uniref:pyridoxamine 5'-phosphate oxidase family protein n=1 Tax=Pantoea sp. C2G6 TaxID=3243084 RepID=UPI003EDB5A34